MQIAHTADQDFMQIQLFPILLILSVNITTVLVGLNQVTGNSLRVTVMVIMLAALGYYVLYVFSVVNILADVLHIKVFRVVSSGNREPLVGKGDQAGGKGNAGPIQSA